MAKKIAVPLQLLDGSWGALVLADTIRVGDEIIVSTEGRKWIDVVSAVLWMGKGKTVVATESGRRD